MTDHPDGFSPTAYKDIVPAIARGDTQYVIDALHSLPPDADAKRFVRMGFASIDGPSTTTRSFAVTCMATNQLDVLAGFVARNDLGISMEDCCTRRVYGGHNDGYAYESLLTTAVRHSRPDAVRMAFRLEDTDAELQSMAPVAGIESSLLFTALFNAVQTGAPSDLECAQILFGRGALMASSQFPTTPVVSCLLSGSGTWMPSVSEGLRELLVSFHAQGLVNLAEAVKRPVAKLPRGRIPLDLAIETCNHVAARQLVLLGSPISGFLKTGCRDLLEHVKAYGFPGNKQQLMLASLNEALMVRKIEASGQKCGAGTDLPPNVGLLASSTAPAPAPTPMRARRASL